MQSFLQDLKYGIRGLVKHPGLTAVAVLSLGLGIGANTTVFTWMETFVLRPLPAVSGFGSLVGVHTRAPGGGDDTDTWSVSYPDFLDWRAQSRTLDIAISDFAQAGLRNASGETERVWVDLVSENFFGVLDVPAALGRTFQPGEEAEAAPVVVLGWAFWQRRFAGDSSIIGRTLSLNGQAYTVIGVAAPRFGGPIIGLQFDMFAPVTTRTTLLDAGERWRSARQWQSFDGIARLKPGVTFAQAREEIDAVAKAAGIAGGVADHQGAVIRPLSDEGAAAFLKPVFIALLGITVVVLLIACANVANLLLARAASRRREIAIRLAVGASRGRLIRQLLTESVVLAALAGGTGLVLTQWGANLMLFFIPAAPFPIGMSFEVGGRVVAFALAMTVLAALAFGLLPALQASKPALAPALKDEIGGSFGGRHRLQNTLVVAQVALSLVSLVSAGLFVRSMIAARNADIGFTGADRVLLVATDLNLAGIRGDSAAVNTMHALLERVRAVPGVQFAAVSEQVPLGFGGNGSSGAEIEGYQPRADENMSIRRAGVTNDWFAAMGLPVTRGRAFEDGDERSGSLGVVVNEAFVTRYWPGLDPLGRWIDQGSGRMTVVGVVKTAKYSALNEAPKPFVYRKLSPDYMASAFTVYVRTTGEPTALTTGLRRAFADVSAQLPFLDVRTFAQSMQAAVFAQRMGAYMLAGFGAIALLLSAIGIYGVMAYTVTQRTREIGVRVALGAGRAAVLGMVLRRAMRLAVTGLGIGLVAALGAGQLLRSQLFGVSPSDPLTYVAIALLLGAVAFLASWLPAQRAARLDPVRALRSE